MSETTPDALGGAFSTFGKGLDSRRSWGSSLAASAIIYGGLVALVIVLSATAKIVVEQKPVELTFVEKVVKAPPPPPPPPPAPPAAVPKPPPAAAAPVVRADQKIRRLKEPPKPKELTAPKEMPKAPPKEADPSQDKGIAVHGDATKGDPAGLEGGQAGGVAGGRVGGAIALPEDASPPMPIASNTKPTYPSEAKASGKQGVVILKVTILANGDVAKVEVMRGEEPFTSAAVSAVKSWKYTPAMHQGQPITVYRIIQIPFKLTA